MSWWRSGDRPTTGVAAPAARGRDGRSTTLPAGPIDYFADADALFVDYERRVRLLCLPGQGTIQLGMAGSDPEDRVLAAHPLLTIALLETMKRFGRFPLHAACLSLNGGGRVGGGLERSGQVHPFGHPACGPDSIFWPTTPSSSSPRPTAIVVSGFPDEVDVTANTVSMVPELRHLVDAPIPPGRDKYGFRVEDVFGIQPVLACRPAVLLSPRVEPGAPPRLEPADPGRSAVRADPQRAAHRPGGQPGPSRRSGRPGRFDPLLLLSDGQRPRRRRPLRGRTGGLMTVRPPEGPGRAAGAGPGRAGPTARGPGRGPGGPARWGAAGRLGRPGLSSPTPRPGPPLAGGPGHRGSRPRCPAGGLPDGGHGPRPLPGRPGRYGGHAGRAHPARGWWSRGRCWSRPATAIPGPASTRTSTWWWPRPICRPPWPSSRTAGGM